MTPTVMTITNAVGNGTTSTYTFSSYTGPAPTNGTPVIVAGCTTAGFNGNFVINGGNLTTTFTVASATNHSSEAESGATGTIDREANAAQPTAVNGTGLGYALTGREAYQFVPYGDFSGILSSTPGQGQIFPQV